MTNSEMGKRVATLLGKFDDMSARLTKAETILGLIADGDLTLEQAVKAAQNFKQGA